LTLVNYLLKVESDWGLSLSESDARQRTKATGKNYRKDIVK